MAILAECPSCHRRQKIKNKKCMNCDEDLDRQKQGGKVKYWIIYRLDGKQIWEPALDENGENLSINDVKAAEGKRRGQKTEKKINTILDVRPLSLTVDELVKWYLSLDYIKDRKNKTVNLRAFSEHFGNEKAEDITDSALKSYQTSLKKEGLADATVDGRLSAMKVLMNQAFKDRKVTRRAKETFESYERLLKKGPDGKPANAREGVYTYEQITAIHEAIKDRSKLPWKILSWSGMREGEVLELKADRIDLKDEMIRLRPEDTKEKKKKDIPILDDFEEIEKLFRERPDQKLFSANYSKRRMKDAFVYDVKCAHRELGIPYGRGKETLTTHSLRHTYKTNATRANVSQSARMRLQGHTTREMDLRYTHLNDNDLRRDARRIFDQMVKGSDQAGNPSDERLMALIEEAVQKAISKNVDKTLTKSPLEQKEATGYVS